MHILKAKVFSDKNKQEGVWRFFKGKNRQKGVLINQNYEYSALW
ncbi:MAG: hypothetical protein ACI8O8_000082 [Oleiphilaceae bacterium]|jgi:hypothetical protein